MKSTQNANWQQQQRSSTTKLAIWTVTWLLSLALATFGPMMFWQSTGLSLTATAVNVLVGIAVLIANRNQLRSLDELQQKIQLEAMGLTLGITIIIALAYTTLDSQFQLNAKDTISNLMFIIGITYIIGLLLGRRKYQ